MRLPLFALSAVTSGLAHSGVPIRPRDLWHAWSFPPGVVLGLAASGALYATGLVRLRQRGRARAIGGAETACFALGWAALVVALMSPLHELGGALLSAHMVQHELLMLVAAPLLVLGQPLVPILWALPSAARHGLGRLAWRRSVRAAWAFITRPSVAWTLHATAILLWHLRPFYQRSMLSDSVHAAQHASFLVTALLFWWALLRGQGAPGRPSGSRSRPRGAAPSQSSHPGARASSDAVDNPHGSREDTGHSGGDAQPTLAGPLLQQSRVPARGRAPPPRASPPAGRSRALPGVSRGARGSRGPSPATAHARSGPARHAPGLGGPHWTP